MLVEVNLGPDHTKRGKMEFKKNEKKKKKQDLQGWTDASHQYIQMDSTKVLWCNQIISDNAQWPNQMISVNALWSIR
uniref:Uncharacterized protein n=1 Tax=Anguilla anguilla TaxID=7936 RepID=A0A0E9WV89_ANGAN